MRKVSNIYWLGVKELRSFLAITFSSASSSMRSSSR